MRYAAQAPKMDLIEWDPTVKPKMSNLNVYKHAGSWKTLLGKQKGGEAAARLRPLQR